MTVQEFVEGYNKVSNEKLREDYIKRHIKKEYVDYYTKATICRNIANATTHTFENVDGNEIKIYKENSIDRKILFDLKIVENYTDIDIIYDTTLYEQYNYLLQFNILPLIYEYINDSEILLFTSLLDMAVNDIYVNEHSVVGLVNNCVDSLNLTIKSTISTLIDYVDSHQDLFDRLT